MSADREECPDEAAADAAGLAALRRACGVEVQDCPVCRGVLTLVGDTSCCQFCGYLGGAA